MRSMLMTAASVVLVAPPWAYDAVPVRAVAHSVGGMHGGGVNRGGVSGPRGPFHRSGNRNRGRGDGGWGAAEGGGRTNGAERGLAVGLAAALVYGYADYYGDYDALPLVAPDYGYPSAFDNGQWPYSASSNPYHPRY